MPAMFLKRAGDPQNAEAFSCSLLRNWLPDSRAIVLGNRLGRRRLCEIAATYVRYGHRRLTVLLRREGWKVNAKRIYRLYAEERLIVRTKQRRKMGRRQCLAAPIAVGADQCWKHGLCERQTG
jgi:transposase InsO family protein